MNSKLSSTAICPTERVQALSKIGASVEIKKDISPIKYFRSGIQMERVARIYVDSGDLESAYIMLHKFITLFVEKLPEHPTYASVNAIKKKEYLKKADGAIKLATLIKEQLLNQYKSEYESYTVREEKNKSEECDKKMTDSIPKEVKVDITDSIPNIEKNTADNVKELNIPEEHSNTVITSIGNYDRLASDKDASTLQHYTASLPTVHRSTKPAKNSAGDLRVIRVPSCLDKRFLAVAQRNTCANIETCGILSGRLVNNMFEITHVIVPKQHGTSDSCTTENEEEIFNFQDSKDLITLGWIHTHPTQTSFLSSVDMHTQYSYQIMIPEAIAIVCAPKYERTGYYSLTRDHGLNVIGRCQEVGFHPHQNHPPLFEDSCHIELDSALDIQITNLRTIKT